MCGFLDDPENKFVLVPEVSEHEIDKHPLRSKYFSEGSSTSVIDCSATDLMELKALSLS